MRNFDKLNAHFDVKVSPGNQVFRLEDIRLGIVDEVVTAGDREAVIGPDGYFRCS